MTCVCDITAMLKIERHTRTVSCAISIMICDTRDFPLCEYAVFSTHYITDVYYDLGSLSLRPQADIIRKVHVSKCHAQWKLQRHTYIWCECNDRATQAATKIYLQNSPMMGTMCADGVSANSNGVVLMFEFCARACRESNVISPSPPP